MDKLNVLANTIVNYSLKTKKDENILIEVGSMDANLLVKEIVKEIIKVGANVEVRYSDSTISNLIEANSSDKRIDLIHEQRKFDVDHFDSFVRIRSNQNDYDSKNISSEILRKIGSKLQKVNKIRINERKWVLLNYPSKVDAYKAKMSYDEFYNFSMNVMCYDYQKMASNIEPLKKLMEQTKNVRIVSPETDLTFSIEGMPVIPCVGEMNIPDGEIFCGPIKNSVNGTIKYNTPSPYQGYIFEGVKLTFENGKIISATCDNREYQSKLDEIFNTDEGSKYVGEFSLGLNPLILDPMGDILFDEKIKGSIHFTPGSSYKESYNGNDSSIHWDMVLIQRKEYGGGEIYFDHILVRKDGKFVLEELQSLNK